MVLLSGDTGADMCSAGCNDSMRDKAGWCIEGMLSIWGILTSVVYIKKDSELT
ncbi:hypothetical protein Paes_2192 [Prosthecochloris aestuarii DSM 271]|uniref:Uncharacterized protein n=1 Tax=Prosthecochloris aestuarii (strain DSM 271 / SK 413) TaxID=290512 RepID=B4S692_PROA2|nr:hypothetical protein Paes_2192 [Prosthecochloris aestuarii DSM 271]